MQAVPIVGVAAVSAAGVDLTSTVEAILKRRTAIVSEPALAEAGLRSSLVARLPALDEARWLADDETTAPREHRVLLAVLRMALADAGIGADDLARARVGLVAGTSAGGMAEFARALRGQGGDAREGTYFAPTAFAARALGIRGPVHTVSSACASGAIALALAADLVGSGEADLALAAGFDLWSDFVHAGFDALGALSPTGPRPFRGDRTGLVLGEAAAAAVVVPAPSSRPLRGRILGAGLSGDARHITAPDREGLGVVRAIAAALADAGVSPGDLDLIGAHGTGTPHNDAMEGRALLQSFGAARLADLPVHSVKPIIGHTLGAAGILEALVVIECLRRGVAPPTLTSDVPDPDCEALFVPTRAPVVLPRARTALKLSSGFGGSNAALVLSCA